MVLRALTSPGSSEEPAIALYASLLHLTRTLCSTGSQGQRGFDSQRGRRYRATLALALRRHPPPCLLVRAWWALSARSALLLLWKLRPIHHRTSLMIIQVFLACLGCCRVVNPVGRVVARTTEFFFSRGWWKRDPGGHGLPSRPQGASVSSALPSARYTYLCIDVRRGR